MTGPTIRTPRLRAAVTTGLLALSLAACASSDAQTRSAAAQLDASANQSASSNTGATLSARQEKIALAAAHREADRVAPKPRSDLGGWPENVTSVSATIAHKTITDSNTGNQCDSGTVVVIKLIGTYDTIGVGLPPYGLPDPGPVTAVDATADLASGEICLVSVQVGPVTPDPGATILFKR